MRRLKKIAEAIALLKRDPAKTIRTAWSSLQSAAREGAGVRAAACGDESAAAWVEDCIETIDVFLEVVIDIITDKDEPAAPAKPAAEGDKP
jgi:hypothetical protein